MVELARLFFRVLESTDGDWVCRSGRHEIDRHAELADALVHIRKVAEAHRPAEILVHHLDGRILSAALLD